MPTSVAKPTAPTGEGITHATVTAIDHTARHTILHTAAAGEVKTVVAAGRSDIEGARRRLGSARRIDRVEIMVGATGTSARVRGKRHRLPFTSAVPLPVALGLAELGIHITVSRAGGHNRW